MWLNSKELEAAPVVGVEPVVLPNPKESPQSIDYRLLSEELRLLVAEVGVELLPTVDIT